MHRRYARAAKRTGPKVASTTPGIAVEGHWLDERRYFFLDERFDPKCRRIVATPSVAHAESGRVEEVLGLEEIAHLLSSQTESPVDAMALASAHFDMLDADTLVVSVGGLSHILEVTRRRIVSTASRDVPALYSPDGRHACLVKGHDLWLLDRRVGNTRPLTTDGAPQHCYGQESESCLAIVSYRKRPAPLGLWSPDSQWFLTHRIDERSVPDLALLQNAPPCATRPVLHRMRCPFPGDTVPLATYVAFHVSSGKVVVFDEVPSPVLAYSPLSLMHPRAWFAGRDTAWALRLDRYCKHAELIRLDLAAGTARVVVEETTSTGYLEFHQSMTGRPNVWILPDSDEAIWFSERDGWGHLYLYDTGTGQLNNRITTGDWMVRDIVSVDEKERTILFTACGIDPQSDPARRSLCSTGLDGTAFTVLVRDDGDLGVPRTNQGRSAQDRPFGGPRGTAGISPDGRFAAIRCAHPRTSNVTRIVDLTSKEGFPIATAGPMINEPTVRQIELRAADGVTPIYGALFLPPDFDEARTYPVIDNIYPGPQIAWAPQSFATAWTALPRALAELGFITLMLDTRCMPFRSRPVHQAGYGELLEPQLSDHAAAIRQLCGRFPFIDGNRVGMIGMSGGGFATARALFDYGEIFKVGVAVCGNHDSNSYSAMWSDKYRGPGDADAFAAHANAKAAPRLEGKLLLISGDMDENVHVSQTLVLVDALIRANRDFDLLIVPNAGHDVLLSSGYVQRRAWDYFVQHLLGADPPRGFELNFEEHELARRDRIYARERQLWG